MRFVDTNVLVYRISDNLRELPKRKRAEELLTARDLATSVQALQEFYVQATRQTGHAPSHELALNMIRAYSRLRIQEMTLPLFEAALRTKHRFGIDYWDAAIIEAARMLGCDVVLSEDLSNTQDYDGVRVVNPFKREASGT